MSRTVKISIDPSRQPLVGFAGWPGRRRGTGFVDLDRMPGTRCGIAIALRTPVTTLNVVKR
ncbi:MAG: hypothetical protein ACR2JX_02115 [Mycobacteriales bacterium]